MSEEKRRETRRKAYHKGHAVGVSHQGKVVPTVLENPYKAGSQGKADIAYAQGYADGVAGKPAEFKESRKHRSSTSQAS